MRARVREKILQLLSDPFPRGVRRVEGHASLKIFRVRVGGVRVLYEVDAKAATLGVIKIDKRAKAYH